MPYCRPVFYVPSETFLLRKRKCGVIFVVVKNNFSIALVEYTSIFIASILASWMFLSHGHKLALQFDTGIPEQ
jgi:hypothetical protein